MTTSNDTTDSHAVGPPSLLANSIKVLSRFMDPLAPTATTTRDSAAPSASSQPPTSEESNSWLNSSDVKRLLAPDIRLGIMIHGVWEGSTRWKGVRDLAQGVDAMYGHQVPSHTAPHDETLQHESAEEDENDIDDWDASSSASSETLDSIIQPISPLPILDFSFSQFDDAPGVHRLHGSTLSREYRQLARFLRSHSVRTTVEAISFAGSSLTLRQAVELLSSGVDGKNARVTNSMGWIKLRSVSLAGLKTGSVDELKVALLKLARYGSSLEFIDLSGIELFPQQNWHWKALLSALLSARSGTDRFDYPALTVLGFRDNNQLSLMEEGSSPATSSAAASSNKGGKASGDDRDSRTRRMNEYEMEVKQLVRSFGRARWLDIVVK
ncbi:hypothetical protein QFC19_009131 [Naganishia cerealis]|uniref:Uncharacterized protein n=1 Tax=Naganishia cerealis TaxID=610337 RepID=A0ACC2UY64_9TREE|nr:hypothetical protein QFC19_009131 [Naganishia cerealis]